MDEMFQIFSEAAPIFDRALIQIGSYQRKQQEDQYKMDIQNENSFEFWNNNDQQILNVFIQPQFLFFDRLPDNAYSQSLDLKISNIKMNSVSVRRKDELFKRHKREQQQKLVQRRKEIQQRFPFNANELKFQGEFWIKKNEKNQIFAFKIEDFDKLRPQTDLNDTIMDNYLKLMQFVLLSQQVSQKTFIFSTFFMGKLLGDLLKDEMYLQRESQNIVEKAKKKVIQNYPTMKRWIKKIDIFAKEYLVVPINAFKHWNCMIIVSPSALLTEAGQCKIIYLDSMFEKKLVFSQAIKTFLQLQLADRKKINISLQNTVQTYQFLVPRQTNTHDCGIYTLMYIENMLRNHELLDDNMEIIRNREHLKLFPRSIIFAMRQALRILFRNLLQYENKEQAIKQYLNFRAEVEKISSELDFDEINQRQFKKYYRLNSHLLQDKKKKESEVEYQCKVKFYLDSEVNHYEKDSTT